MKTKQLIYLSTVALATTFSSCKKDIPDPEPPISTLSTATYDNGVFITNEGPFQAGSGTVSFYSRSTSTVSKDIFEFKNLYPLGNVVQSMEIFNSKGYIVVNNAGTVEVVDGSSFISKGTITGLTNPRYFLGITNDKGYVTEWGAAGGVAGAVKVIDLNTKTVTSTISTGKGAEGMVMVGNFVYVACGGGFGNDSVVTVINATTNAVVKSIHVGANPKSLKVDSNGKIWVLCNGKSDVNYAYITNTGTLARINPTVDTVDLSLPFALRPSNLVINGAKTILYYSSNGKVYSHNNTAVTLNSTATINRSFHGFGIDPTNDYFYGSDAGDFVSNGKVLRYNATGVVVDSFTVGVIPSNFCFN